MGFFKNKIKVKREVDGDHRKALIDYHRANNPIKFKTELLKDLIDRRQCFVVIDTRHAYKASDVAKDVTDLYEYLEKQEIKYRKVITTSDYISRYMGFNIKSDNKKINNHKIGIIITSGDIGQFLPVNKFNAYYYIGSETAALEELPDRFLATQGEMDSLTDIFDLQLYMNDFISMISLSYFGNDSEEVENILKRHMDAD